MLPLALLHGSILSLSQLSSGSSGSRQLYGCNLTPLFSLSTLDALGENITCQAPLVEPNVSLVSDY